MSKMKLSCHGRLDGVWSLIKKTIRENDVTDCIGLVYVETKTSLLGPLSLGEVCDENQKDNNLVDQASAFNVD